MKRRARLQVRNVAPLVRLSQPWHIMLLSIGGRFGGLLKLSQPVRACDETIYR